MNHSSLKVVGKKKRLLKSLSPSKEYSDDEALIFATDELETSGKTSKSSISPVLTPVKIHNRKRLCKSSPVKNDDKNDDDDLLFYDDDEEPGIALSHNSDYDTSSFVLIPRRLLALSSATISSSSLSIQISENVPSSRSINSSNSTSATRATASNNIGSMFLDSIFLEVCKQGYSTFTDLILEFTLNDSRTSQQRVTQYLERNEQKSIGSTGSTDSKSSSSASPNDYIKVDVSTDNNKLVSFIQQLKLIRSYKKFNSFKMSKYYNKYGSSRVSSYRHLFEPLMNIFLRFDYVLLQYFCQSVPFYVMSFLQSNLSLETPFGGSNYDEGVQESQVHHNLISKNNNVVDSNNNSTDSNIDTSATDRYPSVIFQLIEDDWFLPLCTALSLIDESLCQMTSTISEAATSMSAIKKSKQTPQTFLLPSSSSTSSTDKRSTSSTATMIINKLKATLVIDLLRQIDRQDGSTIVHWATEANLHVCLCYLLKLDPTLVHITDQSGMTPLHCACMMGSEECIDVLLDPLNEFECDIMAADKTGWTPFLYAVYRSQVKCALKLLKRPDDYVYENDVFDVDDDDETVEILDSASSYNQQLHRKPKIKKPLSLTYDFQKAELQLKLLGSIVPMCAAAKGSDTRLKKTLEALGTIPEFYDLINAIIHRNSNLLDEDFGFLVCYPFLLDIQNKLVVAKKACIQMHQESVSKHMSNLNTAIQNIYNSTDSSKYNNNIMEEQQFFPCLCGASPPSLEQLINNASRGSSGGSVADSWTQYQYISSFLYNYSLSPSTYANGGFGSSNWYMGSQPQQIDESVYGFSNTLSSRNTKTVVRLARENPWKDLVELIRRIMYCSPTNSNSYSSSSSSSLNHRSYKSSLNHSKSSSFSSKIQIEPNTAKVVDLFRRQLCFQFSGSSSSAGAEVGFGPGVEREVLDIVSQRVVLTRRVGDDAVVNDGVNTASSSNSSKNEIDRYAIFQSSNSSDKSQEQASSSTIATHQPIELKMPSPTWLKSKKSCKINSNNKGIDQSVAVAENTNDTHKLWSFEVFGMLLGNLLLRSVTFTADTDTSFSSSTIDACLNMSNLLSITFSDMFWKLITEREDGIVLDDLASVDPVLCQNLIWLRDNQGAEFLDLYFTIACRSNSSSIRNVNSSTSAFDVDTGCFTIPGTNNTGTGISTSNSNNTSMYILPLTPNGESTLVTDSNKHEYISATLKAITHRMIQQAAALRRGLYLIIPRDILQLFNTRELQLLLSGSTEIDIDDWQAHTRYEGGYHYISSSTTSTSSSSLANVNTDIDAGIISSCGSAVIPWFWKFVSSLSTTQKALLLKFCTGTSKLPTGGFVQLTPRFCITRLAYNPHRNLPTAATCFHLLRIPEYPNEALLRKQMLTAILYGSEGFSFS